MTISATKSQIIMRNISMQELKELVIKDENNNINEENASLNIEIYFQLKPIISLILNYITCHFSSLTTWPQWTSQ